MSGTQGDASRSNSLSSTSSPRTSCNMSRRRPTFPEGHLRSSNCSQGCSQEDEEPSGELSVRVPLTCEASRNNSFSATSSPSTSSIISLRRPTWLDGHVCTTRSAKSRSTDGERLVDVSMTGAQMGLTGDACFPPRGAATAALATPARLTGGPLERRVAAPTLFTRAWGRAASNVGSAFRDCMARRPQAGILGREGRGQSKRP